MANTYKSLLAEKAMLERKIAQARKREVAGVIKQINELIAEYDLTPQELTFPSNGGGDSAEVVARRQRGAKRGATRAPAPPKYRNPDTGETWSGRGRAPKWIVGDKANYLI